MVAQVTTRGREARADGRGGCRPELLRIVPPVSPDGGEGAACTAWPPVYSTVQAGPATVRVAVAGEGPPLRVGLRLRGYAQLVTRVLDALGLDRVDVLGCSWGGAPAQQLAHQAPDRVRALVLAATTPGVGGQPPSPWVVAPMSSPARHYSRTCLRLTAPVLFGIRSPR